MSESGHAPKGQSHLVPWSAAQALSPLTVIAAKAVLQGTRCDKLGAIKGARRGAKKDPPLQFHFNFGPHF